jgi:hypothetical protein
MGQNGQRAVQESYRREDLAHRYIALFNEMLTPDDTTSGAVLGSGER